MNHGELYELCGLGWRLPIWAKLSSNGVIEVTIAEIPMLKAQREAAEAGLRVHCTNREGNTWFFTKKGLEQSAIKSQFTDPEDVVVWSLEINDWPAADEFVRAYCKSSLNIFRNPAHVPHFWESLCLFMRQWILVRGGEVDFGFAKLTAVCARANWKAVVVGRLTARRRNGIRSDTEKVRRETRRLLHQNFITACDEKSQTVRWTLEITPGKIFHEIAQIGELIRKRERGSCALNVLKFLKSPGHKNKLHALLDAYQEETKIPCALLPHGFDPHAENKSKWDGIESQAAPNLSPTPIVNGASMKDKSVAFVSLNGAAVSD